MAKTSVFVVPDDSLTSNYTHKYQPDQLIPESKKDATWYWLNMRHWLSYFNQPIVYQTQSTVGYVDPGSFNYNANPAFFMLRMILYYLGDQTNLNYNHIVQDVNTTNLQATWIKGQQIKVIAEKARGAVLNRLAKAKFDAYPIGKEVINKEEIERNLIEIQLYTKELISFMDEVGLKFQIADPNQVKDMEDIDDWMDKNFKQKVAEVYTNLTNGIWTSEGWGNVIPKAYLYAYICGVAAVENYMLNGRPCRDLIMPYHLLLDRRKDNDYGDDDEFIGWVRPFNIHDVFKYYPELLPYKDDILTISNNQNEYSRYNTSNINWFCGIGTNMISVAKVYWKGFKDVGAEITSNKGITELTPIKSPEVRAVYGQNDALGTVYKVNDQVFKTAQEAEDYAASVTPTSSLGGLEEIYSAIMVAGKYLIRCKPIDNVVHEPGRSNKLVFPIQRIMPNMFLGQSVSEVARLFQEQDSIDMIRYKIMQLIGDAKGMKYVIKNNQFANSPQEFIETIATMPIIFAKETGEVDDPANRQNNLMEMDFRLDPMIQQLHQICSDKEETLNKIASASDVSLGQQSTYIGLGAQQQQIAQGNNGIAYFNDSFFNWIVRNMRYQANMMKNYLATHPESEYSALLGNGEMRFIQMNEDKLFEYVFVKLEIEDSADDAQKSRWSQYLQALSQNPASGFDPLDVFEMDITDSPRVTLDEIKNRVKRNKKDMMAREDEQMQQQSQMQQQQSEIMMQIEQMKEQMETERVMMKEEQINIRTAYVEELRAATKGVTEAAKSLQIHQQYLNQQALTSAEQEHEKQIEEEYMEHEKQLASQQPAPTA